MTTATIERVTINALVRSDTVQIRTALARDTVERYADALEHLPPIVVYRVEREATDDQPAGFDLVIADGFHRVAAFEAKGQKTIPAEIREGTLADAEQFAAVANATSGRQLTTFERNAAIRRLARLNRGMKQADIASSLSVSQQTVSRVLRMDKVRADNEAAQQLPDSTLDDVMTFANTADRDRVIDAAVLNDWSRAQTRQAIKNLQNPNISDMAKRDILAGKYEPVRRVYADGHYDLQPLGGTAAPDAERDVWEPVRTSLIWLADAEVSDIASAIDGETLDRAGEAIAEALEIHNEMGLDDEPAEADNDETENQGEAEPTAPAERESGEATDDDPAS